MTAAPSLTEEFAHLVDAVQDYAIFLLGRAGEIRSWNRGAARIMGYSAGEIVGEPFSRFYTEEDLRDRKPLHELEIAAAEGRVEDEGWRVRSDGRRFWANTIITALRDDDGNLTGFAKVTRDLTERRDAEELLRQNEEQFRLLVESVSDYAIFMLDPEGHIETWNTGARRIKGYEAAEIVGRHFSLFYTEEDARAGEPQAKLRAARERGHVEDEGWRVRKDGTRFWANVIITAVHDEHGTLRGFAKVTRDITEKKQAEEVRRALLEQREARVMAEAERRRAEASFLAAEEASRTKDEFLMTLSHELRTPMTAILGWARMLSSIPPGDPLFREAVESINRSATLQARLIEDVLDVSRIAAGKLSLERETMDVEHLVRGAIDGVRPMAEGRGVTISATCSPDLGVILADATRLHQVIWNLLTNAVKFTPRNGLVRVHVRREPDRIEISVQDTGEGIDPQFLPQVFEPFRQAENPNTRVHGGLGLGLSIVRSLVEAHGGSVAAESEGRGRGSTFTVRLPNVSPRRDTTPLTDPAAEGLTTRLDRLRILVVDDDRDSRDFVKAALRLAGAHVIAVDSPHAALEQLGQSSPNVLVTDIAMPGMDGFELARTVRRDSGSDIRIVALSAFQAGAATAGKNGFDEYLTKPIDPRTLVDAIARVAAKTV